METPVWTWSKECSFSSCMEQAHALIDETMQQVQSLDWSPKEQFAINMALEEALVNAVQHGNHSDPSKQVHFVCCLNNDHLYVRIEDEGEGFDPSDVPDPTDEDHIMVASGRGVLLIRSFVSRATWNDKGNILEFEKDRVI